MTDLRFRPADGFTSMSIGGFSITRNEDDEIIVPEEYRDTMISHGHVFIGKAIEKPSLPTRFTPLNPRRAAVMDALAALPVETLEAMLAEYYALKMPALAQPGPGTEADNPAEGFDPATITLEDLPALKRGELFAVLKARGGHLAPPCNSDDLRKAIAKTFEG